MIRHIFHAPGSGQAQIEVAALELEAGRGIPGDRHFGLSRWKGQNLTLVELEAIEAVSRELDIALEPGATRRNLVTQGVRLNPLLGRTFRIGEVVLKAVELCHPCLTLGRHLGWTKKEPQEILELFAGRGGLRCDVLEGGTIRTGMALEILSGP